MKNRHLMERVLEAVDLSTEPVPGKTLIEIVDNRSILIENHCGVISYGKERPDVFGSTEDAWSKNRRSVTIAN